MKEEKLRELVNKAISKMAEIEDFKNLYPTGIEDYDEEEGRFSKEVVADLFSHPHIIIQLGGWVEAREEEGEEGEEPVITALLGLVVNGKAVETGDMVVCGEYDPRTEKWEFYWDSL